MFAREEGEEGEGGGSPQAVGEGGENGVWNRVSAYIYGISFHSPSHRLPLTPSERLLQRVYTLHVRGSGRGCVSEWQWVRRGVEGGGGCAQYRYNDTCEGEWEGLCV